MSVIKGPWWRREPATEGGNKVLVDLDNLGSNRTEGFYCEVAAGSLEFVLRA